MRISPLSKSHRRGSNVPLSWHQRCIRASLPPFALLHNHAPYPTGLLAFWRGCIGLPDPLNSRAEPSRRHRQPQGLDRGHV